MDDRWFMVFNATFNNFSVISWMIEDLMQGDKTWCKKLGILDFYKYRQKKKYEFHQTLFFISLRDWKPLKLA